MQTVASFSSRMKGRRWSLLQFVLLWQFTIFYVVTFQRMKLKDAFRKEPVKSGINKDFPEKSTDFIATEGKMS